MNILFWIGFVGWFFGWLNFTLAIIINNTTLITCMIILMFISFVSIAVSVSYDDLKK
jgi:hypothetical protein|tara:strand:- start:84 stop:254 length:171 start_codon:yes stop_codon:yes gene_type:complete